MADSDSEQHDPEEKLLQRHRKEKKELQGLYIYRFPHVLNELVLQECLIFTFSEKIHYLWKFPR